MDKRKDIYWLVYQQLIIEQDANFENETLNVNIINDVMIRKVFAKTKEDAINKFIIERNNLKIDYVKTLPIEAFELEALKSIL